MEALKRAEKSKQDEQDAALSTRRGPAAPLALEAKAEAALLAFAGKEALPASRPALWATLALIGVAGAGVGAYVWYQIRDMEKSSLVAAPPTLQPAGTPIPARTIPATAVTPAETAPAPAPIPSAAPAAAPLPPPRAESANPTVDSPAAAPEVPIRVVRTHTEIDPSLTRGYRSLQAGDVEAARIDYEEAWRRDPKNVDVLLGLAAIAQRQGHGGDAERYRQFALEADPKDAAAQAAAIGPTAPANPLTAESRLKNLLAAQPESGSLNFALGNLYSREQRWAEAQRAYFNAVAADGDNPDYLYNLAVSLDHLRQPRPAAQHYRQALEAAERRPAAFERERAKNRLQALQP